MTEQPESPQAQPKRSIPETPPNSGEVKQLRQQLEQVSAQLEYEQTRQQILLPYRVARVRRGVIGDSRYAKRLRQSVRTATFHD